MPCNSVAIAYAEVGELGKLVQVQIAREGDLSKAMFELFVEFLRDSEVGIKKNYIAYGGAWVVALEEGWRCEIVVNSDSVKVQGNNNPVTPDLVTDILNALGLELLTFQATNALTDNGAIITDSTIDVDGNRVISFKKELA